MVKDIARLGRLTQSQARMALEELVTSGTVVARKVQRPARLVLYAKARLVPLNSTNTGFCRGPSHEAIPKFFI
jgi:hypothetical protein